MTPFSRRTAWSFGLPALLDLFDGDRAAIGGLLEAATAAIARDIGEIEAAAAAGDRDVIGTATHRLKGTSGTIDAAGVFNVAAALETAARDRSAGLAALIAELRLAFAAVEADVTEYLAAE